MNSTRASFRTADPAGLATDLQAARDYTLCLFDCLAAAGYDVPAQVPQLDLLNPPLWELGHIAWFAEWFILREASASTPGSAQRGSLLTMGDDWFDSNTVAHGMRWRLGLPSSGALKTYCHEVLDRVLDKLSRTGNDDAALYPYRLALAHEDMHGEMFASMLQTLGVPLPACLASLPSPTWAQGDIRFAGGTFQFGSEPGQGFVFDNEKYAHARHVQPFAMNSTLISNAQYSEFVDDEGYRNPRYWSPAGRAWLMRQQRAAPRDWRREAGIWRVMRFGRLMTLAAGQPARHLSLYEAQAYCAWAGRRLPSEAEWEFAALSGHPALRWGDLWEWTCSPFESYSAFTPDRYREYSAPWFGTHQALRGASFVTQPRMRSPKYRNFYLPERHDIFVGFRTCAL